MGTDGSTSDDSPDATTAVRQAFGIELGDRFARVCLVGADGRPRWQLDRRLPSDISPLSMLESSEHGQPSPRSMARTALLARLRGVLFDAEQAGHPITEAVMVVPAGFGNEGRLAVREAAQRCGLRVIDLLDAPVAAAVSQAGSVHAEAVPERVVAVDVGPASLEMVVAGVHPRHAVVQAIGALAPLAPATEIGAEAWLDTCAELVVDVAERSGEERIDRLVICGEVDHDLVETVERALGAVVAVRVVRADAVVVGAAIHAAAVVSGGGPTIRRLATRGIGFVVEEVGPDDRPEHPVVAFVVHRGDPLPARVTEVFATTIDDQLAVEIAVAEQRSFEESPELDDNVVADEGAVFPLPAGCPAGTEVEIVLDVAADGVYTVSIGSITRPDEPGAPVAVDVPDVIAVPEVDVPVVDVAVVDAPDVAPVIVEPRSALQADVTARLRRAVEHLVFLLGDVPAVERRALVEQARRDGLSVEQAGPLVDDLVATVAAERVRSA